MLQRKTHIPYSIYRAQPLIYVGSGVLTLFYLPNVYGILSGLLLVCAGVLVVVWRSDKPTKKRQGQPTSQAKRQTKHNAGMQHGPGRSAPDNTRASVLEPEENDFSTTKNPRPGHEPDTSVRDQIKHIDDGTPVTGSLLSRFSPFNELDESLKESLARGLVVSRKPAGTVLIKRGSKRNVSIYLIDGTLTLKAADGKKTRVVGGTPEAFRPLCQLSPHIYSAVAHTEVAVIMLSQTLLRDVTAVVAEHKNMPGIEVSHLVKT